MTSRSWIGFLAVAISSMLVACPAVSDGSDWTSPCEQLSAEDCEQAARAAVAALNPNDPAPMHVVVEPGAMSEWVATVGLESGGSVNVPLMQSADGRFAVGIRTPPPPSATTPTSPATCDRHDDPELESTFPSEVGGKPICTESLGGYGGIDSLTEAFGPGALLPVAMIDQLPGTELSDFSMAFASHTADGTPVATAMRVEGTTGADVLAAWMSLNAHVPSRSERIAGRDVVRMDVGGVIGPTFLYASRDAFYSVEGNALTESELTELFASLP